MKKLLAWIKGYALTDAVDYLIHNIKEGIELLLQNPGGEYNNNSVDCYWMKLQERDNWKIIMPSYRVVKQLGE